ncbi:MAG: hypothetical protein HC802_10600 [Caldilineaceae bacterium]|nr:hypothetical protein [Caldilineaceae bacterium]
MIDPTAAVQFWARALAARNPGHETRVFSIFSGSLREIGTSRTDVLNIIQS